MFYYSSIADYFNKKSNSFHSDFPVTLISKHRPLLQLVDNEELKYEYSFLIRRDKSLFEVGFPLVKVTDFDTNKRLAQLITIETNQGEFIHFYLEDEVLDET
ncbi:MAG: hypothetical protein ACXITR_11810 [Cyanobacterium sp.]